jgi:alkylation response protein AidB-like acyl-CoA dehydrogenase
VDVVLLAKRLADDVLFPAALSTDASDVVAPGLLDSLAEAGLYGLVAPANAGGLEADFATACAVAEALASGCLTTAFVWGQHHGLVRALVAGGDPAQQARWLAPLAAGQIRAGLALGGALPRPALHARPAAGGWVVDGISPFVSGWGRVDVVHAAARAADNEIVWLIIDAVEGDSVRAERLRLAALDATATVRLEFGGLFVPAERVTGTHEATAVTPPEVLRMHAAWALGVAARCCQLLGPSSLDAELVALRAELDRLGRGVAAARAAAGEFAVRAACALMTARGSRSLLAADDGQRLAREALFTLSYALRPQSRAALLTRLGAPEHA